MLNPEGAMEDRIILLGGVEIEPDASKSGNGLQVLASDVCLIVPDEAPPQGGPIAKKSQTQKQGAEAPTPHANGEERTLKSHAVGLSAGTSPDQYQSSASRDRLIV